MSINDLNEEESRIIKVCKEFGLSIVASIDILNAVKAYQNYDKLPQATKYSMQEICDMFNVNLVFTPLKRGNMALTGIWNELRATYLYTKESLQDRADKKYWLKNNDVEYFLKVGANHKFEKYVIER